MAVKEKWVKDPEQDLVDRDWGNDLRKRALACWRELTGAGICETEPRYAHVDALAVPVQPNDKPYFVEVQARRAKVGAFPTLMFDKSQLDKSLAYHEDLGFPTLLLAVWEDGLGHLMFPCPKGNPVAEEKHLHGRDKVMLDIGKFDWISPDLFRKHFPENLFN